MIGSARLLAVAGHPLCVYWSPGSKCAPAGTGEAEHRENDGQEEERTHASEGTDALAEPCVNSVPNGRRPCGRVPSCAAAFPHSP